MDNKNLKSELTRANAALVDKLGRQPFLRLDLILHDSGKWRCGSAYLHSDMQKRVDGAFAETPEEALASIFDVIAAMPDPDVAARHDWQKKLADVIDEGHKLALPDEVIKPLREGAQAMTKNLLTRAPGREVA